VMQLDQLDEDEVPGLELRTGIPLVYDLGEDGTVRDKRTLDG
jgi:2,3-bisphosphoglycerate-dependent phosphoglycerate mutase